MAIDPHAALLFFLTLAAGGWMLVAGVHKNALEWRRRKRACPACGRLVQGRACGCVD